jgi:hypothetical protein
VPAANAQPPIPAVITDADGKFLLPNIDEGTYSLTVQANGYLEKGYVAASSGRASPIRVAADETLNALNVALVPAGNISGRIRDIGDKPMINVPVQLLRFTYSAQGQRMYQSVGSLRTNDRGEYRFYWVNPGRYYLLAGVPTGTSNPEVEMRVNAVNNVLNPNLSSMAPVFGYVFYPGVTEFSSAGVIDLQPGSNLNADLTFPSRPPTFSIRGRLIDSSTGQQPTRATLSAIPQIPGVSTGNNSGPAQDLRSRDYNASNGTFEVRNLLPGTYLLTAVIEDFSAFAGGTPPRRRLIGTATVVLPNADVEGVAITALPAASIMGRLRVDGQLPSGIAIERTRVQLTPVNPPLTAGGNSTSNSSPRPDGTFQFSNIAPGRLPRYRGTSRTSRFGLYKRCGF